MSIQTGWYAPQQIILLQMIGQITLEEMEAGQLTINQMLHEAPDKVHLLVDFSRMESMPMSLREGMLQSQIFTDPRIGWIAAYAAPNRAVLMLGMVFSHLMRIRLKNFTTQEEALAFLHGLARQ